MLPQRDQPTGQENFGVRWKGSELWRENFHVQFLGELAVETPPAYPVVIQSKALGNTAPKA